MAGYADLMVTGAHLFTMQGAGWATWPMARWPSAASRIAAVGPTADLAARFEAAETIDASDCAVLPGLIDAHMHTPLAIVRGVAQDVAHWMQKALAPYSRHITPEARAGRHPAQRPGGAQGRHDHACATTPARAGWAEVFEQMRRARPPDADHQRPAAGRHGRLEGGRPLSL